MRINFLSYRKWSWPINAVLYNLCRLIPFRNKKIWVFGTYLGLYYDDNTKYLFEYVNQNGDGSVRPIWLSKTPEVVKYIKDKGWEAYLLSSFKGIWFSIHCGVAIYTNGLGDFGTFPLVGGAILVTPWHGMGFKKIYNVNYHGNDLKIKLFFDHIFSWVNRDITFVTSQYTKKQFVDRFSISPDTVFITGQPRNDEFKKGIDKTEILSGFGIEKDKSIILYMPTFRSKWQRPDTLQKIINQLTESTDINNILERNNSILLIKLHPSTHGIDIPNNNNFCLVPYGKVKSNQELLLVADAMITDYSSCFVDYALLNRPIMFYVPDEDDYLRNSGDMDKEFFEIYTLCKANSPSQLALLIQEKSLAVVEKTNRLFEAPEIAGTCYSQNVYDTLLKVLHI
ncbi:MAG: CDP-glycerol glycerophosphotransferase family protein [Bacteroidaceae bacterium]|nr:CDP-glycerol glycerophosphotransferase family protein [Bacteroidaceae bacterium]